MQRKGPKDKHLAALVVPGMAVRHVQKALDLAVRVRRPEMSARTFPEFIRMRLEPFARTSYLQQLVAGFGIVFNTITGIRYEFAFFAVLATLMQTSLGGFWSVAATDTLNAVLILVGLAFGTWAVLAATGGMGAITDTIAVTTAPINVGGEPMEPGIMLSPAGTFGWSVLLGIFMANAVGALDQPLSGALEQQGRGSADDVGAGRADPDLCLFDRDRAGRASSDAQPARRGHDRLYHAPDRESQAPAFVGAMTLIALLAAAVSTANSLLLNCGTSIYCDIYRQVKTAQQFDDASATRHLRLVVLGLGFLAVIRAIKPALLPAMGFTYVYGAFGAAFMWPVWLGLFWKRMTRAGAYAGIAVGATAFIAARVGGSANAFTWGAAFSLVATLVAVYPTPRPPKEAWEPYFQAEVSPSTRAVALRIQRQSDTAAPVTRP
ncbi:sodium:solute symporter [Paracoccus sp. PAMC 22219]|uniref:sodium:solute symporter family protein n=1 Tax=Paracoccus sp. PAMC 22219 TaxID=1569209 RepID=UPI0018CD0F84|nr:sodium:solute symporter family protein [Paracoccus sp. PAMC 22219]